KRRLVLRARKHERPGWLKWKRRSRRQTPGAPAVSGVLKVLWLRRKLRHPTAPNQRRSLFTKPRTDKAPAPTLRATACRIFPIGRLVRPPWTRLAATRNRGASA